MNKKYSTLLDSILEQIEDLSKRLSRPIKDLDDIRVAMGALKEIRENEIYIDMSLAPIEVQLIIKNKESLGKNLYSCNCLKQIDVHICT